ncbi:unnamed protein product [Rhizoctonia solani]|uniref:Vegetative incompatibility protein HET-E-1 n=1 Tax=Rhizoctonia solani TaxID=456999 RepID=A0A8H3D6F4_9AGAM|nr:unnamed protein product [Rhizoctonia solani]
MAEKMGDNKQSQLVLHELDTATVQTDIEQYLTIALARLNPSGADIAKLVEDAGVLFIYAATAVRYISDRNFSRNPHGRLQTVLNASGLGAKQKNKAIDELYTVILRAALHDEGMDGAERDDVLLLLHTVISLQEPLNVSALCGLLKMGSDDRVKAAIHPLWSVLHVTGTSQLVTTLHASFSDYMYDKERSGVYYCDKAIHHGTLAGLCLDCIDTATPGFNICGLESSFVPDSEVVDLDKRIQQAISQQLVYACRYWSVYVSAARKSENLVTLMQRFLSTRLLLWLEVMNLTQNIQSSVEVIKHAEQWIISRTNDEKLTELIHDAWCFTTVFASNAVCESTPHIYMSMLPFWPSYRPISRIYKPRYQGLLVAEGTAVDLQQLNLFTIWTFSDVVSRVVFSPTGERVALAVGDTIVVVDAHNGRALFGPLAGHTDLVHSLDFSPDGTRIASGSRDKTLGVWNAETGKRTLGLLEGHSASVRSVQYSSNGTHILSSSYDHTVCIWDALNGTRVLTLALSDLDIPMNEVTSVRYSPDSMRIVSGSQSGMVCLWDTQTGEPVFGPFKAHESPIESIDYSPDGQHIVTGSDDGTLRVWSAMDGSMVLGPLVGHTAPITSATYSPNDKHIISGSADGSICIWDAQSGEIILGPIERYTDSVYSLACSPDGSKIVSCGGEGEVHVWNALSKQNALAQVDGCAESVDALACSPDGAFIVSASGKILHVWDAQTGNLITGPLTRHAQAVSSLSYSPRGNNFASGSHDRTICVWNTQTGAMALGPLRGHTQSILSVEYSPDGTSLASGSWDCTIRVWDTQTGDMILLLEGHTLPVTSVQYSPMGTYVASASWDRTIRVWDTRTGGLKFQPLLGHTSWVNSIDFAPDGTRIMSSGGDGIRVWDNQTGEMILGPIEESSEYGIIKYSPEGSCICGAQDSMLDTWASEGGEPVLGPLDGHTHDIRSIKFTPGGTFVVSGSIDKAIRVWDIKSQVRIITLAQKPATEAPYIGLHLLLAHQINTHLRHPSSERMGARARWMGY